MTKKKKPNRQLERELKQGKRSYRLRLDEEVLNKKEIKDYTNANK